MLSFWMYKKTGAIEQIHTPFVYCQEYHKLPHRPIEKRTKVKKNNHEKYPPPQKKKKKERKKKKGDFHYESSLGGIRLTTRPSQVSSCTVQKCLDRASISYKFTKQHFPRLLYIETINFFW